MKQVSDGIGQAFSLIFTLDPGLLNIIVLSLWVSGVAIIFASAIALPLGTVLARSRFPGRSSIIILLNALMGFPPVVVGLIVYLLFSRNGPLGVLDLLFTPTAMIIAQILLALPIVASVTRQTIAMLWETNRELLISVGANRLQQNATLLWEARFSLSTAILVGFGRIIGEVGAVMIVGGNIDNLTRVLTTAIALETRKGNIGLAIGLGIILILIAILINATVYFLTNLEEAKE
ncbi:MAG: ABC transporter permease [Methyloligellaceae bacterium]